MSTVVFKYPLRFPMPLNVVDVPCFSEILDIEFQGGQLCVWMLIDNEITQVTRQQIVMLATGMSSGYPHGELKHIKTIHRDDLVWHFFDAGVESFEDKLKRVNEGV